jgi:DNA-binding NtrC family response regulator
MLGVTQLSDPGQVQILSAGKLGVDSSRAAAPLRGIETILLVDDEKLILDAVGRILRDYGYEVLEADEPESALTLLRLRASDVSLLVTDLMMPGMSGRTLIARCQQIAPGLRVVVMSGAVDERSDEWDGHSSYVRFVGKPFSALRLLREIRRLLDDTSLQI